MPVAPGAADRRRGSGPPRYRRPSSPTPIALRHFSADKKERLVDRRPSDAQGARLQPRVEADKQHAVLAGIDDPLQIVFQGGELARLEPAFMHRFLAAGGVGAHDLQRPGEPARVADVVSDEIEAARHYAHIIAAAAAILARKLAAAIARPFTRIRGSGRN